MMDRPFIHLFKTPLGCYIFDVNTNMILKTGKSVYELLDKLVKGECSEAELEADTEEARIISEMRQKGLLSSQRVKEILHPGDELLEYRLKNKLNMLTLQVTQQCNLRCDYCVYSGGSDLQRGHSNKRMSFETAKKGIDFLIDHSGDTNAFNIGFYGGEPLLEFELIKKCIEYAEDKVEGKELNFRITTNGTMIGSEIIEYFQRHNVTITISLDGPKEIHDKQRRFAGSGCGSFDKVMENLSEVSRQFPEYFKKITFNTVIDPTSDFSCMNEFFINYEIVKENYQNSTFIDDRYSDKKIQGSKEFKLSYNYEKFKTYLAALNKIDKKHVSPIVKKHYSDLGRISKKLKPMTGLGERFHHSGPCIPGQHRLFMSVDGSLFPCERVSESSEMMKIGHVNTGFDIDRAKEILSIGRLTEKNCKSCWAIKYCTLCAAYADNMNEFSGDLKLSYCMSVRANVEDTFKNYLTLKELGHNFESPAI